MKIYISGQITGLDKIEYVKNFEKAKRYIYLNIDKEIHDIEGIYFKDIINPLDLNPFLGIKKWIYYMITDLYTLSKCTHIAMQQNWIESRGCHWEHYFAKFIFKLKVIYL